MRKTWLVAALATVSVAQATEFRPVVESSTLVKGTIVLNKDGTVASTSIDDENVLGNALSDVVRKTAAQWRFDPVMQNGEPVIAKARMSVRLVARKNDSGDYNVRVKGAMFGESVDATKRRNLPHLTSPAYPPAAVSAQLEATTYVALRLDKDGHVIDAVAEQVNLSQWGSERLMKEWRDVFAKAALAAARKWTVQRPDDAPPLNADTWTARIPVVFHITNLHTGRTRSIWQTYVPGPVDPIPWLEGKPARGAFAQSPDALPDGQIAIEGDGPNLLTPTDHG
ncbi:MULTISPECIES: energy transducer TonB [Dyella]|uniref:Energy transducer TonB n=2 Tax=Dyella TaxID=231454 RepID=A0A4V6NA16_9GAMM|nr:MULTISPECIES: energy transducer TonB [Dyella]TBR39784.1 energy transducer TonB [Dyella terrae]TCI12637.1 energy transducer TonB [Dyella soli]